MPRLSAFMTRIAWGVSAMLVLSAASSWAQSTPTLPSGYAESPEFRVRLEAAAADPTIQPWQREFMQGLMGAGAPHGTRAAAPNEIGAADASGEWDQLPPPSARTGHTAIYDPVRDRMVVFGGSDGIFKLNDVWALSLAGTPAWGALNPTGTLPTARTLHSAIYDPVRDRIVVFGGYDDSYRNDVWALSLAGTPAWSALSPTGAPPTGRNRHTAIYDPVRDRMVVFGGYDSFSKRNDVWALSLAGAPAWSALSPTGSQPPARAGHTAVYDPVRDRMVVFGGNDFNSLRNDVWALSLAGTPAWSALSPTGTPPTGRDGHTAIYDPVPDRMVVFGGDLRDDIWALSLAGTPAWSALNPTGTLPTARSLHSAIYDPVRDRMVVFGGYDGSYRNDVWALSLAGAPAWSALSPTGTLPTARTSHTAIYDPVRDRMVVFGGYDGPSPYRNDVWALSLAGALAWSALSPTGTPPTARYGHTAIYDPVRDRVVVFGGDDGSLRNDVWALSLGGTPVWSALSPTSAPPTARVYHTAIYDPVRDHMVLFGGYDGSYRNDIWVLSLAGTPEWSVLNQTGTPPTARYGHTAIYDPVRDRMVVFGGDDGSLRNDVWALSLTATTSWSTLNSTGTLPTARSLHGAIYDPVRDRVVVFGGYDGSYRNDVWALSLAGTPAWSVLSPSGIPPTGRNRHTAIYDPVRDRMVVFGGYDGYRLLNDVRRLNWDFALVGVQLTVLPDPRLGSPFPNPTRDATSIHFDLPVEMHVRVTVYDVAGRLTHRVADRRMPAGSHTLSWAMSRGGDRQAPPGLYYCRVQLGDREFTRTAVVLR